MAKPPRMNNEYLDYYDVQLEHQLEHDSTLLVEALAPSRRPQPRTLCLACGLEGMHRIDDETIKRHFSWAVPNDPALDTIAKHSPGGVVELAPVAATGLPCCAAAAWTSS